MHMLQLQWLISISDVFTIFCLNACFHTDTAGDCKFFHCTCVVYRKCNVFLLKFLKGFPQGIEWYGGSFNGGEMMANASLVGIYHMGACFNQHSPTALVSKQHLPTRCTKFVEPQVNMST